MSSQDDVGGGDGLALAELESDEDSRDSLIFDQKVDRRRKQAVPEVPESFRNFQRWEDV